MKVRRLTIHRRRHVTRAGILLTVSLVSLVALALSPASGAARRSADRVAPSAPTSLHVVSATATSVTIAWSRSRDNVGVAGYGLYKGATRIGTTTKTSFKLGSLACGTTLAVSVAAFDAVGNRSLKASALVATAACVDTQAPSTPTGLRQSTTTATAVTVSWAATTDNILVAGYGVYLNGVRVASTQQTSAPVYGLSCSRNYSVGVDAFDAAGNRSAQASFFVTTSACPDTQAPTAPGALRRTGGTDSSLLVAWGASRDDVGVDGYEISMSGAVVGTATSTVFGLTGLACGRSFLVSVVARDAAGNRSATTSASIATDGCPVAASGSSTADVTPPSRPAGVSVGVVSASGISVTWLPSTDNVGVTGYDILSNGSAVGTTQATAYSLGGLTCGSSYQVAIRAYDAAGNRSTTALVIVATAPCVDVTPPTSPGNVVQLDRTDTSITISWSPATDDIGVIEYRMYRNGVYLMTTAETVFTFTGLACGTSYTLGLEAFDASGKSSPPTNVLMTTVACPDTTPPPSASGLATSGVTTSAATLSWSASTGAAGYDLFVNGSQVGSTSQTTYAFGSLACGAASVLGVGAYDAVGNRSATSTATVTTVACAPNPPPSGASTANVWVDLDGGTCSRSAWPATYNTGAACPTMNAAYQAASQGDTVRVRSASYAATTPSEGAYKIQADGSKTGSTDVTFLCDNGAVTFAAGASQMVITAKHITIQGSCYQLNKLWVGDPANGISTDDVTIDGVSMMMFDISGSDSVTVQNSIVGPSMACTSSGATACRNDASTGEAFFYAAGADNTRYYEPKIHSGGSTGAVPPTNILIKNNKIKQIQTRDPVALHTGCLWLGWGSSGGPVTIDGNTFERCAIYDIHVDDAAPNLTLENNFFGPSVEPVGTGSNLDTETSVAQQDVENKCQTGTPVNYLVRFNTFSHGINLDFGGCNQPVSNVRLIGNILGVNSNCAAATVVVGNIAVGNTCGGTSASVATLDSLVVKATYPIDYHLLDGLSLGQIAQSGSDFELGWDVDGQSRPAGARDPGADQR